MTVYCTFKNQCNKVNYCVWKTYYLIIDLWFLELWSIITDIIFFITVVTGNGGVIYHGTKIPYIKD